MRKRRPLCTGAFGAKGLNESGHILTLSPPKVDAKQRQTAS